MAGFEKMDSGLSLNFKDRVSPISNHIQSLHQLGATPGPLNPAMNDITSDVLKVYPLFAPILQSNTLFKCSVPPHSSLSIPLFHPSPFYPLCIPLTPLPPLPRCLPMQLENTVANMAPQ